MKNNEKVAVLVTTGYEDIELITTIDVFKRANIPFTLYSSENKEEVFGAHNALVKTIPIKNLNSIDYDALFIPGGKAVSILINDHNVLKIINEFAHANKWIFAICAAPSILIKLNLLKDVRHTAYKGFEYKPTFVDKDVIKDKKYITGRGPAATLSFAFNIVETLKSKEELNNLKKIMNC